MPVPGPISRTVSVGLMAAFATMADTTAGFFRKCCPREVFGATRFADADADADADQDDGLPLLDELLPPLAEVRAFREARE